MAAPYHKIIVYPSNIDYFSIKMESENATPYTKSNFTLDSTNDRFYYNVGCDMFIEGTATNYPSPRISHDLTEDAIVIDFRPEHLYALGDDNISTSEWIYVDNLQNPTHIYNNKGWASNNAFDWSYGAYSNFHTINYNSTTNKYDIDCTICTGGPSVGPVSPSVGK